MSDRLNPGLAASIIQPILITIMSRFQDSYSHKHPMNAHKTLQPCQMRPVLPPCQPLPALDGMLLRHCCADSLFCCCWLASFLLLVAGMGAAFCSVTAAGQQAGADAGSTAKQVVSNSTAGILGQQVQVGGSAGQQEGARQQIVAGSTSRQKLRQMAAEMQLPTALDNSSRWQNCR